MAVPTAITDLSVTATSNSPSGVDVAGITSGPDDFFRAAFAILRRLQAQGANVASAATVDLVALAVPEPAPLVLDAKQQMELAKYIASIQVERDEANRSAVYWYEQWKNKKGLCI